MTFPSYSMGFNMILPQYVLKANVSRVIDGDTVVVDIALPFNMKLEKRKVRLYGINTAEIHSKDPDMRKLAQEAKQRVTDAILGKTVVLKSIKVKGTDEDELDAFGRYLMVVFYDHPEYGQVNLNDELVELKLAERYFPR